MQITFKKHNLPGKLIAVCGTDGTGKTTQIDLMQQYLSSKGLPVLLTKQPTQESRELPLFERYIFHPEERSKIDYRALMCLLMGDRLQHIHEIILPALEAGKIVITDRYIFTMIATMRARGYRDEGWVFDLCRHIVEPDITFLFDAPYELVEKRIRVRKEWKDAYVEREHLTKYQNEFRGLLNEADIKRIDTSKQDPQVAFGQIQLVINQKLDLVKTGGIK
ncbi:dTMP kinase [Paenibacillus mesotrionivorans]|jgi:dTMP kinase|uniref:dTMP kinase n=1 Tax=Paenibacillus mesotrionivorans TaxID=3160968 RepID=A0ACC7NXG7_9BACL